MKKIKYLLALSLLLPAGCVTTAKYKALEGETTEYKERLAAAQARIEELEGRLGIVSSEKSALSQEKNSLSEEKNALSKEKLALAQSNEEMKAAYAELQKRKQETEKRLADFRELMQKFGKLVDAGKLKIKFVNGKMVVALSTDILFSPGSAALSQQGQSSIVEVTKVLATLKDKKFQVEGHTDNDPILKRKQFASNWELASARAMTVLKTMLDSGMPPESISAASYGDTQPLASNKTNAGKASNRRIAIVIVPDLTGLPGFDELTKMSAQESKSN